MISFLPPRVPLVDPRTGLVTREWYLLFQSLFSGFGMSNDQLPLIGPPDVTLDALLSAVSIVRDEFSVSPPAPPALAAGATADDLSPPMQTLFIALDDVLPVLNGLRDQIAMLQVTINDMKQGGAA